MSVLSSGFMYYRRVEVRLRKRKYTWRFSLRKNRKSKSLWRDFGDTLNFRSLDVISLENFSIVLTDFFNLFDKRLFDRVSIVSLKIYHSMVKKGIVLLCKHWFPPKTTCLRINGERETTRTSPTTLGTKISGLTVEERGPRVETENDLEGRDQSQKKRERMIKT